MKNLFLSFLLVGAAFAADPKIGGVGVLPVTNGVARSLTAKYTTGRTNAPFSVLNSNDAVIGVFNTNGQLLMIESTASAPSYSFIGDPNTGLISSTTDAIGIVTGGTERWVFNSSGAFNPIVNNTYDIGNGSVNPRDVNVARDVLVSRNISSGAGVYYPSNAVDGATIRAGITNGGFWFGAFSNGLYAVWMSNNAVQVKLIAP